MFDTAGRSGGNGMGRVVVNNTAKVRNKSYVPAAGTNVAWRVHLFTPSVSGSGPLPYRHSYGFDAFDNRTAETGTLWSDDDNFSASYNSQNRNTAWSYDADGRLISTNEDPPNAMTYSPLINTYNAAGQLGSWAQTLTRAPGGVTQTTATTRNQTYDGNGKMVKTAVTQQVNSASPTTTNTYYLISSVTGTAIAEYNGAGIKSKASVYAGGAVIAQQLTADTIPDSLYPSALRIVDVTGARYDEIPTISDIFDETCAYGSIVVVD